MRDHQHVTRGGVGRHAGEQARGVEFGLERKPFFDVLDIG